MRSTEKIFWICLILLFFAALAWGADETLVPTGTAESTANSCTTSTAHGTCDEGPPGGDDWCTASTCAANPTNDTAWRFTLNTPASPPSTATNAQLIRARVRSCQSGGSDPTCRLSLFCNGSLVQEGDNQTVSTAAIITQLVTFSTGSCAADGSDLEIRVFCSASGGTPSGRRTGELDFAQLEVTYASTRRRGPIIVAGG